MAYIALYRKWRPKGFEDVVGQSHITETLQKAIETDKVAHAYLFSGPRGTGKTSTAKIFARAMNCVHGPTAHPCNACEACLHIMSGESLDVVEIDAASNRSIEDIRTLRETIKFMPVEGHKKIYIIDEVHMLTTEAFNALLKTLEEPPAHVIFILATTEPERIPLTILSRCQRYEFRRITSADIAHRLLYVAEQEQIELTKGAAHILAVQADGGMRDALSMFDQCVSNASGAVDEQLVRDLLGLIGKDWLFSLSQAIFDGRSDVIIKGVDDIIQLGKEPRVILTEILAHLRALMLCQAAPGSDTLSAYSDSMGELRKQAQSASPETIFQVVDVLQQALLTAKTSPVPRIAVEMGLLMAARKLTQPVTAVDTGAHIPQPAPKKQHHEAIPVPEEDDYQSFSAPEEAVPFPDDEFTSVQRMAPSVERTSGRMLCLRLSPQGNPIKSRLLRRQNRRQRRLIRMCLKRRRRLSRQLRMQLLSYRPIIRTFGIRCAPFSTKRRRKLFYPVSAMDASFTSAMGRLSSPLRRPSWLNGRIAKITLNLPMKPCLPSSEGPIICRGSLKGTMS